MIRTLITDYRDARFGLDTLVQRLEGITEAIGIDGWEDAVFPIVLAMEQVNAYAVETKSSLSEANKKVIDESLRDLEILIKRYESQS